MTVPVFSALVLGSYVLGGLPIGLMVARQVRGIDIREHGSRNIGATNVGRVLGRKWGIVVWLLDALKGFLPALAAGLLAGHRWRDYAVPLQSVLCGAAAICGHNFSVFLRFRGGKGVSTGFGAFVYLFPQGMAVAAAVWVAAVLATRYVSVGSMLAGLSLAACALLIPPAPFKQSLNLTVVCLAVALLVIVRHKTNLQRLLRGTENKVRLRRGKPAAPGAA